MPISNETYRILLADAEYKADQFYAACMALHIADRDAGVSEAAVSAGAGVKGLKRAALEARVRLANAEARDEAEGLNPKY